MNKGILCAACNEAFSPLDALLSQQLNVINGLLGVRPDRADGPKPARAEHLGESLTIDHTGRPAYAEPRRISDTPGADGRRMVTMQFGSEAQAQTWLADQRAAGVDLKQVARREGSKFFETLSLEWSFGGADGFREIGRIALNFLAYKWPDAARSDGLRPFKDFVLGHKQPAGREPRWVWYVDDQAFPLPESPSPFGHQVLLILNAETGEAFGRVRFFSTFDLGIRFGRLQEPRSAAVLFNIDPLAEKPDDVAQSELTPSDFPDSVCAPTSDAGPAEERGVRERFGALLTRVIARQRRLRAAQLVQQINDARQFQSLARRTRLCELLASQIGDVLFLAQTFVKELAAESQNEDVRAVVDAMKSMLVLDPSSGDGLSAVAREALGLATERLADAVSSELDEGPLTAERLELFLAGGPGLHSVGSALAECVLGALDSDES